MAGRAWQPEEEAEFVADEAFARALAAEEAAAAASVAASRSASVVARAKAASGACPSPSGAQATTAADGQGSGYSARLRARSGLGPPPGGTPAPPPPTRPDVGQEGTPAPPPASGGQRTGLTGRSERAPRVVDGPLPPRTSSSGRNYYLMRPQHPGGIAVACGYRKALEPLNGNWACAGTAPEGFADLTSALNAGYSLLEPGAPREIPVKFP